MCALFELESTACSKAALSGSRPLFDSPSAGYFETKNKRSIMPSARPSERFQPRIARPERGAHRGRRCPKWAGCPGRSPALFRSPTHAISRAGGRRAREKTKERDTADVANGSPRTPRERGTPTPSTRRRRIRYRKVLATYARIETALRGKEPTCSPCRPCRPSGPSAPASRPPTNLGGSRTPGPPWSAPCPRCWPRSPER